MKPQSKQTLPNNFLTKLLACLFIMICFAVGIVGLILPIIPGLLFLAIAAMVAAKISPFSERWFRKSQIMSGYLDSSDGFLKLSLWGKVQYACWLCIKVFVDSIIFIIAIGAKILNFATNKYQYYR